MDTVIAGPVRHSERYLRWQAKWRRLMFFGLTLTTSGGCGFLMFDILRANGLTVLELLSLVLFIILFTWISGAFWTAIAGFIVRVRGFDPAALRSADFRDRVLTGRSAIIVPIYNEDTTRVFAGLEAIWSSLQLQSQQQAFDLFVLSDTRKGDIAAAEELAWQALVLRHHAEGRMFYRRRPENTARKSGNIADFVRNWGGAYEFMIVLDADSVMSGDALVSMAQTIEANPDVAIVQALPLLAGRETFFARLLQFATRLNGPMFGSGLTFWQLGEGNYWGHNAIIRLKAFAEHCALPRLPGAPPFGGEILSHDIVEAAFLRRAGLKTWLVPDISGSWEEVPSNVIDYAARDRRWAQGNLQHLGVMPMRGLHWLSRMHMLTGVLSYATSPLWLLVLVLSSVMTCAEAVAGYQYFQPGTFSLFPSWPEYRDNEIVALLSVTIGVLLFPKVLGATLALRDRASRHAYGGAGRLVGSLLFEQLMSMLLAPTMMLFHTGFVLQALVGHSISWDAQPREDRGLTWREALKRHKWHLLLGSVWTAVILWLAPDFIWWMTPVVMGMVLSVPYTVFTSRSSIGRALKQRGWLLTPEETAPPPELRALMQALEHAPALEPPKGPGHQDALVTVPVRAPLPMAAAVAAYVGLPRLIRRSAPVAGVAAVVVDVADETETLVNR